MMIKTRCKVLLVATAAITILGSCSEQEAPLPADPPIAVEPVAPKPSFSSAKVDALLAQIEAEPAVIEARYEPDNLVEWIVSVKDDGSPRMGYASYICILLMQAGVADPDTWVRVVDHRKLLIHKDDYRASSLGRANCMTDQMEAV